MEQRCGLGSVARWGRVPAWWLLHDAIDADRFCVLAALATYADEQGLCEPSQATLARRLKRSRPWVNRVVAQLAAEGFLEKTVRSRRNGGTTSCLYRLRLTPPDAAVTPVTSGVHHNDSPRHAADRSQPQAEQSHQHAQPARAATAEDGAGREAPAEVPTTWEPDEREVSEALRLCPGADLEAHTARFRARCRAKGYRYRPSAVGDAWLSWLIEDHPRAAARAAAARSMPVRGAWSPVTRSDDRLAAWAAAAASPPASRWRSTP